MNQTVIGLGVSLLVFALGGCGSPPQIGADRDVFNAVDALDTAVSLRGLKLVDRCETTLKDLRDAGKLPEAAFKSLGAIIAEARGGKWEPARDHLGQFMEEQRRR